MSVRRRTPDDLPACVEVLARVHEQQRYPVNWPADPEAWLSQPVGPAEVADTRAATLRFYAALGWRETGRTPVDWGGDVATEVVHLERGL